MDDQLSDDHNRFVPGSEIHYNPIGEHVIQLLENYIYMDCRPDQILTDQGTQFHLAKPSTIRKVEAFQKPTTMKQGCSNP